MIEKFSFNYSIQIPRPVPSNRHKTPAADVPHPTYSQLRTNHVLLLQPFEPLHFGLADTATSFAAELTDKNDVKAVQGTTGHASANLLVNTYAHIQQDSRKKLGKKFEEGFYKPGTTPAQTAPVEAEPTISVSALLELLKDADPAVKAQLRLALLT